jgi:hypothetical protein
MNGNATVAIVTGASSTEDQYGDVVDGTPVETPWGPCAVAPRTSTERADSRAPAVVTGLTVYGPPPPVELTAAAQLRIDGDLYDIEGLPGDWRSPFTDWHPGVEVAVKRASGGA